jgi:hypothetical protein
LDAAHDALSPHWRSGLPGSISVPNRLKSTTHGKHSKTHYDRVKRRSDHSTQKHKQKRRWHAGTRLTVESTSDGVVLKAAPLFAPTRPEDVFGSLAYAGRPKSLKEMEAAVAGNQPKTSKTKWNPHRLSKAR